MGTDLFRDKILILDGAMGTVLQQRGLPPGGKPELLNFTDPELLRSIYREYIAAGSQILCANTFGASTPKLAGTGRTVDEVVSAAVAIAREAAAGTDVKVSLDVGPLGELLEPMGSLTFEGAYGYFQEIALAGERAGADLVSIETMTDLYEAKAALLAVKENTRLPVFVTMSFEADGRTFTGCTLSSMARTLEGLGADAIGLNCSLGPDKLAPFLAELCACTRLPVIAKPNAGLPDPVTGRYGMGPEEFAAALLPCLEAGVTIFGGCCGTTPAHIKTMADALKETDLLPVKTARRRFLASERSHMEIRLDGPFAIIGERINPTGKKKLQEKLREGSLDLACEMAQQQEQDGAAVLEKEAFRKVPEAVRAFLLHELLCRAARRRKDIEAVHVKMLEALLEKQVGRQIRLPYGVRAVRCYEGIELITVSGEEYERGRCGHKEDRREYEEGRRGHKEGRRVPQESGETDKASVICISGSCGSAELPWMDGSVRKLKWRVLERESDEKEEMIIFPKNPYTKWFDYDIIENTVKIRHRRPGDYITISKEGGTQKLKQYFINEKIPGGLRDRIWLAAYYVGCRVQAEPEVSDYRQDQENPGIEILRRTRRWEKASE